MCLPKRLLKKEKEYIKNLQDNWLTFDRDMNFYAQNIANLNEERFEIEQELSFFLEELNALRQAYQKQKLAEIELLGEIDLTTPYIHGTESEIPYLAEKVKNDAIHYFYIEGNNHFDNIGLEYKDD